MKPQGEALALIRETYRHDTVKMGDAFAELFMRVARRDPALELLSIERWADWDRREELTGGSDGTDLGIDLVAQHASGAWIAIQCKCYQESTRLNINSHMSTFLAFANREPFELRWFVATCPWGKNAEKAIEGKLNPPVQRIDFVNRYSDFPLEQAEKEIKTLWPKQDDAIEYCKTGLSNYDRGQLIMACGTGKTFTALRLAEDIVPDNGSILFLAPSISLVSQAREDWLKDARKPMGTVVICSDSTAGRSKSEDISLIELLSPVTTDPESIAAAIKKAKGTRVAYSTYHSVGQITQAQQEYGLEDFDLIIVDEAHRTTGIIRDKGAEGVDFQAVHDNQKVKGKKRLYMTATPRIYSEKSKSSRRKEGWEVTDMDDKEKYGPVFYTLSFRDAVETKPEPMLSDYRVIVLGVSDDDVSPALRSRLEKIDTGKTKGTAKTPDTHEMTRLLGVSLAINGHAQGEEPDRPGVLRRTIAYANTIARSRWYAQAMMDPELRRATTRKLAEGEQSLKVIANHLDAKSSALARNTELKKLNGAGRGNTEARVISNVKLFTEGVNVPALDAVIFLDPKQSQVDIVQAVGRVMRKSEGKKFGYIIVPVVVPPDKNVIEALEAGNDGYKTVGKVLRALQAHDGKLLSNLDLYVQIYDPRKKKIPPPDGRTEREEQVDLGLDPVLGQGIYAHVAKASGLAKPGRQTADDIKSTVERAGAKLDETGAGSAIAMVLGMSYTEDDSLNICKIGALLLANACLLQKRLSNEESMNMIIPLESAIVSKAPQALLEGSWQGIMNRDYKPVFGPARAVLSILPESKQAIAAVQMLAECANRVADTLSELGYDHAGPLYHEILKSAASDGAFYTENTSALMLARLALSKDLVDWTDLETVKSLRILDPACGTGTLLMASLKTIKDRMMETQNSEMDDADVQRSLHAHMVENALGGFDINRHAVQLAACNLTMGAPTVDYREMNLFTLAHGPDGNDGVKLGSLEMLPTSDDERNLASIVLPALSFDALGASQVDESSKINFPHKDLDVVIMNPPFTANDKRGQKFDDDTRKKMQERELWMKDQVEEIDLQATGVINSNSIATFFTPLSDRLVNSQKGTLAKVIPTTACINASGNDERVFIAKRFQVELVVTSHDPHKINFSGNTSIHESLLICRRSESRRPTRFVALHTNPRNAQEAMEIADCIESGGIEMWGNAYEWDEKKISEGDWSPAQWYHRELAVAAQAIESSEHLRPLVSGQFNDIETGETGRSAQDSWVRTDNHDDDGAVKIFDSVSSEIRQAMAGIPDTTVVPGGRRQHLHENVRRGSSRLLITNRFDTVSGRITALYAEEPTFGFGWCPVKVPDDEHARAICAWWNSTPGRLLLLNRRAKKLTYPKWSMGLLEEIPIPKGGEEGTGMLSKVYDKYASQPLLTMKEGMNDPVRSALDEVAAMILKISVEKIAEWRALLAKEPTVSNRRPLSGVKSNI